MSDIDPDAGGRMVAAAVSFLTTHDQDHPTSASVAGSLGLAPATLESLFHRYAGVELSRFIKALPLTDTQAFRARLRPSSVMGAWRPSSRLAIMPWSPELSLTTSVIRWGRHSSPFGVVFAAAAEAGLCWLGFDGDAANLARLAKDWPRVQWIEDAAATRDAVERAFEVTRPSVDQPAVPVLVRGTPFQVRVWQALTAIPAGAVVSYRDVADAIGQPKAARAVGGAVGKNPIAVLIPCHRVILTSGALHHYGWGPARKRALLAWEQAAFGDRVPLGGSMF